MKTIECACCGRKITAARNLKKFCVDCRENAYREARAELMAKYKAEKARKAFLNGRLANDVREAKKLGISYGQYKARQMEGACKWWI